jgi:two-component system, NarL family, invasion response regulator UvrY
MKNILHADDHPMIRAGLKIIIESRVPHVVVDEAYDGDSAFEKVKRSNYDMVILDVSMPGTDSFGLVSNILAIKPETKILMFSMHSEDVYAKKYLQLGVKGYVNKEAPVSEIENAISLILSERKYMSPFLTQLLTEEALGKKTSNNPFDNLSPREFEIVQHLAKGETVASISRMLNLHTSTIGTFKSRIFEKLNCSNLVALNSLAKVNNILQAAC